MCVAPFASLLYSGGNTAEETNDFFVCAMEGLEVCLVGFGGAPDGDVGDEVWVCKCVVELDKCFSGEGFVDVSECVDEGLEFSDDVVDVFVEFQVVL